MGETLSKSIADIVEIVKHKVEKEMERVLNVLTTIKAAGSKRRLRSLHVVGSLASLGLIATACGGASLAKSSTSTTSGASSVSVSKVTIGTASDPNLSPLILVAQKNGYFKQNGLNVKVAMFSSGAQLVSAAASGNVQFGSAGDAPAINLVGSGAPVNVIAQTANISGSQALVAIPGQALTKASLEKAKIGLLTGTTGELLVKKVLSKFGVTPTSSQFVNTFGGTEVSALQKGDIQLGFLWQPWLAVAKKQIPNLKVVAFANYSYVPGQKGPHSFAGIHALLFGSTSFETQHPKTTAGVLKSLESASEFIKKHPGSAAQIVSSGLNLPLSETKTIMSENSYTLAITSTLAKDEAQNISYLASVKPFKKPMTVNSLIDPTPLSKAFPSLVTWKPSA